MTFHNWQLIHSINYQLTDSWFTSIITITTINMVSVIIMKLLYLVHRVAWMILQANHRNRPRVVESLTATTRVVCLHPTMLQTNCGSTEVKPKLKLISIWCNSTETYVLLQQLGIVKFNKKRSCRWGSCQLKSGKILHKCSMNCTWKGLQQGNDVQGHSRSLTLVPFDRPHMISY